MVAIHAEVVAVLLEDQAIDFVVVPEFMNIVP